MKLTVKRFWMFKVAAIGLLILSVTLISCNNRKDLTDNYSIFTYGEGLYDESETDYPIFVSKLAYEGEPPYIPNVKQVWWDSSDVIIEQTNGTWWVITSIENKLTSGDTLHGPLSIQQKESLMRVENLNTAEMKYKNYE